MHEMKHEYIWAHWDNQRDGCDLSQREAEQARLEQVNFETVL